MAEARVRFDKKTIALVYDFDGTLCPQPMQEYTVLPELGVKPRDFWARVNEVSAAEGEEKMLTYMRLLLEQAEERRVHVGRAEFAALAPNIRYFPGVEDWFDRINGFVKREADSRVELRHYVISAGLREILDGVAIRRHFHRMYASEYHYNHHKVATFPKLLITDTAKTQFLFRINKGKEELTENINSHMPVDQRPIPFKNIIYIGDGETDVPSMTVTRTNGGTAIAVYPKGKGRHIRRKQAECAALMKAGRVNFVAPADYSEGSVLDRRMKLLLKAAIARIAYEREVFACKKELGALEDTPEKGALESKAEAAVELQNPAA